jgi:hypothetical protein
MGGTEHGRLLDHENGQDKGGMIKKDSVYIKTNKDACDHQTENVI